MSLKLPFSWTRLEFAILYRIGGSVCGHAGEGLILTDAPVDDDPCEGAACRCSIASITPGAEAGALAIRKAPARVLACGRFLSDAMCVLPPTTAAMEQRGAAPTEES